MTPRSPKQPPPKTTTISRRLRNRADQNISVQPPELAQLKALRSRRAATTPSLRHISGEYQTEEQTSVWETSIDLDPFTRSNTSHPVGLEQNATSSLLLSHPLDFPPYNSPQPSPIDLLPLQTGSEPEAFQSQPTSASQHPPSPLPSVSGTHPTIDYDLRLSPDPEASHKPAVEFQDMSTLGFVMPAQYGSMNHYGSPTSLETSNYPPMNQNSYTDARAPHQQHPPTSGGYMPSYTSSSAAQDAKPRVAGEPPILPSYQHSPVPRSPYEQPLASMRASPSPMSYSPAASEPLNSVPHSYTYPAVNGNLPGQGLAPLASNSTSYPPPPLYPPTTYEMSGYNSLPPTMYPPPTTSAGYQSYEPPTGLAPPNATPVSGLPSSPSAQGNGVMPRVLNTRPKPQCWEHGCNGRQFSTFSNLLRHQREKSGTAAKSYCPRCGAEFTRTTARNGHMAHEKCKPRRTSDSSR